MKKTVLVFSCEPGGAEVLIPVVRLLAQTGSYRVIVLAYGLGLERFRNKGTACREIEPIERNDPALFQRYKPDLVITSATSLPERDMSEKYLWQTARQHAVKTLAFIDQWQNYAVRFSGPSEGERLAYLPDYINCIDELGRKEMIAEGFRDQGLLTLGHPYLSGVPALYAGIKSEMAANFQAADDCRNTLLFVSEPIKEHFAGSRGYDQYQSLDLLLSNVLAFRKSAKVIIKLHPKDDLANYQQVAGRYKALDIRFIRNELSSLECLALTELVFGMSSIMLIEAFILGKTVVSIQPHLIVDDPLLLSRHNMVARIKDYAAFDPFGFISEVHEGLQVHFDGDNFIRFLAADF